MSWFRKGSGRSDSGGGGMAMEKSAGSGKISPSDTDPDTCLEVFKIHWKQALTIIQPQSLDVSSNTKAKPTLQSDDIETVIHNVEQMVYLIVSESSANGMPGTILLYLLEHEILEKFSNWCSEVIDYGERLKMEQLKMYEMLIGQAKQLLLIHKPIIQPLLKLLSQCAESLDIYRSKDLERRVVLVLHQLCVCLSQQTLILESFFLSDADHGPAKFLIFSLLIPYVHREGNVGQEARDALLLIMALSAKHDNIGHYVAENSHFCPVLATGLSGLYSSLPRKLNIPSDDWHQLAEEDIAQMPDLQMFLYSLEFCNAVAQVAHPLVREQLISYIYNGFLVPVLGPALHQNSRDEIIAATAYLELFLRRISEPALLRAFLKFVVVGKFDEITVLDSLIARINTNSRLCVSSLSVFKTLVELNCEDVMFQLVFRYLIPCTHVMVSQRRAVKELDLYSKSAEKFLSLQPACCQLDEGGVAASGSPNLSQARTKAMDSNKSSSVTSSGNSTPMETDYMDYLHEAQQRILGCARACRNWSAPYNGELPPPDSDLGFTVTVSAKPELTSSIAAGGKSSHSSTESKSSSVPVGSGETSDKTNEKAAAVASSSGSAQSSAEAKDKDFVTKTAPSQPNSALVPNTDGASSPLSDLSRCLDLESFMSYLDTVEVTSPSTPKDLERFLDELDSLPNDILIQPVSPSPTNQKSGEGASAENSSVENRERAESLQANSEESKVNKVRSRTDGSDRSSTSSMDGSLRSRGSFLGAKYPSGAPNIGPFLSALLSKLEGMMQNSLYVNLLLTGLISRLACYPTPLLRSFLLNHNLVFQPSVKSLMQVLTSVRQKVDNFASTQSNFDVLLMQAWKFLTLREQMYLAELNGQSITPVPEKSSPQMISKTGRSQSVTDFVRGEKRRTSISDLLFKKSPAKDLKDRGVSGPSGDRSGNQALERSGTGYRFVNAKHTTAGTIPENPLESLKTKNAVFCALILKEFVKELASLAQEHAVLALDEGYASS